jgi:hypothetical protein
MTQRFVTISVVTYSWPDSLQGLLDSLSEQEVKNVPCLRIARETGTRGGLFGGDCVVYS